MDTFLFACKPVKKIHVSTGLDNTGTALYSAFFFCYILTYQTNVEKLGQEFLFFFFFYFLTPTTHATTIAGREG